MKVHIHDNNNVPTAQNCLGEFELEPQRTLTLHMHPGECQPCPQGHCHQATIVLVQTDKGLFVVFEGVRNPSKITLDAARPHMPVEHEPQG